MTDMRGRHGANFEGSSMNVSGDDEALNHFLDDLEYVSGVVVMSRNDVSLNSGCLSLSLKARVKPRINELAMKYGLKTKLGWEP